MEQELQEVRNEIEAKWETGWGLSMEEIVKVHEQILYPTVLVRTAKAGGSGTVIYSEPHHDGEGYHSFVLTNYHVIDDAISFSSDFDPLVGRDVKRPIKQEVQVGFYTYRHLSQQESVASRRAEIVHWDKARDLALLELHGRAKVEHVATLFPETGKHLYMMQTLVAVGCSLGHKPLPSEGKLSSLDERIENQPRIMSSAQIIYGSSGGGLYTLSDKELVGIPCAGDVVLTGFSAQMIPHLGYSIPWYVLYDFIREGCYDFLFDESKTYEECMKERDEKMDDLQRAFEERFKRESSR